jgi:hypothetical protein
MQPYAILPNINNPIRMRIFSNRAHEAVRHKTTTFFINHRGVSLIKAILAILAFFTFLSAQSPQPEYDQKGGVAVGFPDIINIKYQYYIQTNYYIGLLSFISATRTFGFLPVNLPSVCIGYEPYRDKGRTLSPGIEFVTTWWIGDQVIKGSFGDTAIDIRANHLILTLRPYLSIGKTWGVDLTLGVSSIQNWEKGQRHGFSYREFFSSHPVFPSFAACYWLAF